MQCTGLVGRRLTPEAHFQGLTETDELHATTFLKTAQKLDLEGPVDWSARLEEYLYDDPSARGG